MELLGDLEAEVMDRMWARIEPATVRDILGELQPVRPLAYTTVMTVMDRLFQKGWLTRERAGRGYAYTTTLSRSEYTARQLSEVLSTTDNRGMALLHFVRAMDTAEAEALSDALRWRAQEKGTR
ncbi:BlaI/MecI/CopY family transcriptional regulator [Frankia sp. AgB1.9]|uniref:BlaI/MecI/CopY family transcriptional regulator n=1 Tax=unclassified Frankia TaxID=2632575 RepID=UPI001931C248|nr:MULTISPECIES: BlaI/MecI/CopY family transcriptional regulator [unclassified Frankia]MBL7492780.1 BlaI/MecI/CopY family transcriptional regulator [Frankia sp. AgW1.1]MBL7549289.1 BlaI/MecI/CopY family transcriptional regulator [Frankia sp. AgB1.9]MBL7619243.1 BlaI/MecI/CopY family transcriptional regulator [Frankia sp. AgB1.8]